MSKSKDQSPHHRIEELELHLRYRHGLGEFSAFFDALTEGRLIASRCLKCGDCRIPPRIICPVDHSQTESFELSGEGRLVRFTTGAASSLLAEAGPENVFGEVALEGVTNRLFARIKAAPQSIVENCRVRLARTERTLRHPIQALVFEPIGE